MHVYLCVHAPPAPGAPEPLTTYVSPRPAVQGEIEAAARSIEPAPVLSIRPHELRYPEPAPDPVVALEQVRAMYADCTRCHLSESRNAIVHFRGNPYSPILAFGEGPGKTEDIRGIPFCGASGRLQDSIFAELGLDPERDIAWANLVGCRPCVDRYGGDRPPTLVEKVACSERTLLILRALRPRVVLCLGKESTSAFSPEAPHINRWIGPLVPPQAPDDYIFVAHIRHPASYLHMGVGTQAYKDMKAELLFLRVLNPWLRGELPGRPALAKVSRWPFGLSYLSSITTGTIGRPEAAKR